MTDRVSVLLEDRGVLAVSGADTRKFLQDIVSNDVTKVGPDRAIYASLLTAQGKFLHEFFMVEFDPGDGPALVLDGERNRLADLTRRLTLYKMRAKVDLADLSETWCVAALFGGGALEALGLDAGEGVARAFGGGVAFADPRLDALGVRALLPRTEATTALREAGFAPGAPADYDLLRLGHGVPDGSRDIIIEKSFPLEVGFDELHAIDYDKGCYIGQELTARTHHRGKIRKRLFRVDIEGPLPAPGTPVHHGEQEIGQMRSGLDGIGLALLRIEQVEAAAKAGEALSAGDARLTPVKPGWASF